MALQGASFNNNTLDNLPLHELASQLNIEPPSDRSLEEQIWLDSMVLSSGVLGRDCHGYCDFYGQGSGVLFTRTLQENLHSIGLQDPRAIPAPRLHATHLLLGEPRFPLEFSMSTLPSRTEAILVCRVALEDALVTTRFVHRPSFYSALNRIYSVSFEQWTSDDWGALPLLYTYFNFAHRSLQSINCHSLSCLQAICALSAFLQSVSLFDQSYYYIGLGVRCALRLGLHRSFEADWTPIVRESRKRVFWALRQMDIFLNVFLGTPQMLAEDDIDQEYPLEIDDEYISQDGISSMSSGVISLTACMNSHTELSLILLNIIRDVYPTKGRKSAHGLFQIDLTKLCTIEKDMQIWKKHFENLSHVNNSSLPALTIAKQTLHLLFLYSQMLLYRPFLRYVDAGSPLKETTSSLDIKHSAVGDAFQGREALLKYAPMNLAAIRSLHALEGPLRTLSEHSPQKETALMSLSTMPEEQATLADVLGNAASSKSNKTTFSSEEQTEFPMFTTYSEPMPFSSEMQHNQAWQPELFDGSKYYFVEPVTHYQIGDPGLF
ncbi:hypothetical protein BDV29DRAFT_160471 [Aspergillus leporis]|uniref:Xylanolytic transcriptional activator regulatory domain-containing protein n=1 Tax=Aspergillus leporis TaxID=41062 RepID=A0A5N5WQ38_9EURO|nr:hypothetical protein BDV29DRAFT_160471 [Aspergillus leporis]